METQTVHVKAILTLTLPGCNGLAYEGLSATLLCFVLCFDSIGICLFSIYMFDFIQHTSSKLLSSDWNATHVPLMIDVS